MELRVHRTLLAEFGIAAAAVGAAFLVRTYLLVGVLEEDAPLLYFVLPVIAAGWLGGFRVGLLATLLSTALCMFYFLPPVGSFSVHGLSRQFRVPIFIAGGALISWGAGAMHDAQQRAQAAARALRIQEKAWRRILTSIGDAVIAADDQRRVTFLNNVAASLTGWEASEAQGRPLEEVYHTTNDSGLAVDEPINIALSESRTTERHGMSALVTKDGRSLAIDEVIAPICRDADHTDIGVVVVFRDVTERRAAEMELRDSDRRKGEFLATLSHELRNPVGAVKNALQLMTMIGHDESSMEPIHERMDRQLDILIRLIDDLQDVSRIGRGKLTVTRKIVDLRHILRSALDATEVQIRQHHHQLTVEEAGEHLLLDADPERLAQVFINLINNAARYTPPGGQIWVTCVREGNEAVIRVQDHGIGISCHDLPRIFELFAQIQPTRPEAEQGLGIGLALVRWIVELHGGSVTAESGGHGKGSRFTVCLPLAPEQARTCTASTANGQAPTGTAFRVLLVEDSRDNAELLSQLLTLMGHEVQVAEDAAGALQIARDFVPQIILSDISMPHMDGYELAVQLRAEAELSSAYLVAVTGHSSDDDRKRSRNAGFDEHLVKPVDVDDLKRLFASLADGRVPTLRN